MRFVGAINEFPLPGSDVIWWVWLTLVGLTPNSFGSSYDFALSLYSVFLGVAAGCFAFPPLLLSRVSQGQLLAPPVGATWGSGAPLVRCPTTSALFP